MVLGKILLTALLTSRVAASTGHPSGDWPWQTFKSSPAQPPSLRINKHGNTSPGYLIFNQNGPEVHNYSLFIMSDDNELVWQSERNGFADFRVQTFEDSPVLTHWQGLALGEPWGFGVGIVRIYDESYENIYNVSLTTAQENIIPSGGLDSGMLFSYLDFHESRITRDGTMLVTVYNVTEHDLSPYGGPRNGWVTNSLFYEMDIKTNTVLYRWSALDHTDQIPIDDAIQFHPLEDFGKNKTLPYDYFHLNSVDKLDDGSYIISSRFFCSIFRLTPNGTVEWTFQGENGGDFKLASDISFRYQHDARVRHVGEDFMQLSLFNNDNSAVKSGVNETTGIFVTLDTKTWTATLDRELVDPTDRVYAKSQGNTQFLDNGNVILGYGSTAKIKEFTPDGSVAMSAVFGHKDGTVFSYRSYRFPWIGRPKTSPSVYACIKSNETQVYMSWNGATEHKTWQVFAGSTEGDLSSQVSVARQGFETAVTLSGLPALIQVEAKTADIDIPGARSAITRAKEPCT
ncbi:arylsulfotransferase protein [Purpureocillium lilacinum]|nr:arylsulfotransferase protein [Purpureocillium lilacinum]OAQ90525.1 arylsulfotransferase protein [Purpureocillium lilacinum]